MNRTRTLILTVASIVIVCFTLVWIFHYRFPEARQNLVVETSKALLQLACVAALGGLLKLLYDQVAQQHQETQRQREQEQTSQQAANEIRKGLLNDLIAARSRVEEVRIRYRIDESDSPFLTYKTAILAILDARLNLSRIWNALNTASYLFTKHQMISDHILEMKRYLDRLIDEFEKAAPDLKALAPEQSGARIRQLPLFSDFILDAEKSTYGSTFLVSAYRPAVTEIRKEVVRANKVSLAVAE